MKYQNAPPPIPLNPTVATLKVVRRAMTPIVQTRAHSVELKKANQPTNRPTNQITRLSYLFLCRVLHFLLRSYTLSLVLSSAIGSVKLILYRHIFSMRWGPHHVIAHFSRENQPFMKTHITIIFS